jgi:hypothetical protein
MRMALTVPQYTVADLELLPDDGNRYEVLAGTLLVTPSPGSAHQGVACGSWTCTIAASKCARGGAPVASSATS